MLPTLKKNSKNRLARNKGFQRFLQNQDLLKSKVQNMDEEIEIDEYITDDHQLIEAVNIMKDMIYLQGTIKQ